MEAAETYPDKPKVSVLVAFYNAEKYISKCIESLVSQTLKNIEILCVDDCSTDSSAETVKTYSKADKRIKLIQLDKNQGQAHARNIALKQAKGEYVTMLDSDDWMAPDSLEILSKALDNDQDAGCALFRLILVDSTSGKEEDYVNNTIKKRIEGYEAFKLSLDWQLHGVYLVRADIHKRFPYDESCRLYSDDNTTRLHYLYSKYVVITDAPYFYLQHPESATTRISTDRFIYLDANLSMRNALRELARKGEFKDSNEVLSCYEIHRWMNVVGSYMFYYKNKSKFNAKEIKSIHHKFKTILSTIDSSLLPASLSIKFGYIPFKFYPLFKWQEELYFLLRKMLRRL